MLTNEELMHRAQELFESHNKKVSAFVETRLTSAPVFEISTNEEKLETGLIIDSTGCSSATPSNDTGYVFGETSPEAHNTVNLQPTTCLQAIEVAKVRLEESISRPTTTYICHEFFKNMKVYLDAETPVKASKHWNRCLWLYQNHGLYLELEEAMIYAIVYHQFCHKTWPISCDLRDDDYFYHFEEFLKTFEDMDTARTCLEDLINSDELNVYNGFVVEGLRKLFYAASSDELYCKPESNSYKRNSIQENNLDKMITFIIMVKTYSPYELTEQVLGCFDNIIHLALPYCSVQMEKRISFLHKLNTLINQFENPQDESVCSLDIKLPLERIKRACELQATTYSVNNAEASVERLIKEAERRHQQMEKRRTFIEQRRQQMEKRITFIEHLKTLIEKLENAQDPRVNLLEQRLRKVKLRCETDAAEVVLVRAIASVARLINGAEQTFQHEPTLWAELCRKFAVFFIHVRAALCLIDEDKRNVCLEEVKPAAQKTFEASGIKETFFGKQGVNQDINELDRFTARSAQMTSYCPT